MKGQPFHGDTGLSTFDEVGPQDGEELVKSF